MVQYREIRSNTTKISVNLNFWFQIIVNDESTKTFSCGIFKFDKNLYT